MKIEPDFGSIGPEQFDSESPDMRGEDGVLAKKREEIISNWFSYTTSHGLGNLFRASHSFLKLFWILCYLSSIRY